MASVVEALVDAFQQAGTPFIVGIPGEESLEMIEAARQRGMRFILMKQESAGAMLAATWGEITGIPGVCLSTRAPGAANMVLGVTHAWMDRCPLIAITDQCAGPAYATGLRQRLDQLALYSPITKWNSAVNAEAVHRQARRAILTATAHAPGPVQLDMPADERLKEAVGGMGSAPLLPEAALVSPDAISLAAPLRLLKAAKRPVLLVGLGTLWSKASTELVSLAEKLGAPVFTTTKCKGAIPEDHRLSAGCIFGGQMERRLISQADLIITVGLDAVELQPLPWPYSAPVLALSSVRNLDAIVPATLEVCGDLKGILAGLCDSAPEGDWGEKVARAFRQELNAALDSPGKGLTPQRLMDIARSVLPRDTIATCDVGAGRLFSVPKWPVYAPRDYLVSNGIASMGFAVPAAMAARIAHPDRPVVALIGDGSFLMAIAELHTCVKENLPITILVLDNGGLGVMGLKQELKGAPRYGTDLGGIDWEHLAAAFGADCTTVESENALGDALAVAAKSGRTTIIAAKIVNASHYLEQYQTLLAAQRG